MAATSIDLAGPAAADLRGADLALLPLADAECGEPALRALTDWVQTFLMRPHAELGRPGHVCPFTSRATREGLVRLGASAAHEPAEVAGIMRSALRAFDAMACTRATRIFRTVVVAFPRCDRPDGIATLRSVQNGLRHHSILGGKMIGLFEPASDAEGLINPAFRPLRAPVPALAVRMLVAQDAPFVLRNPLLAPIYLATFPLQGPRRLWRSHRANAARLTAT